MNAIKSSTCKTDLSIPYVLAKLLERFEWSRVPAGAEQYRSVVRNLVSKLGHAEPGNAFGDMLDSHQAAAEFYENVFYQHAGLCQSALDASLASEQQTKDMLGRAMRLAQNRSNPLNKEDFTHGKS